MTKRLPAGKLSVEQLETYVASMGLPTDKVAKVVLEGNYESDLWNHAGEAGAWATRKIRDQRIQIQMMKRALEKIACRHVKEDPLWWQDEARQALIEICDS